MSIGTPTSYEQEDQDSLRLKWVIAFIALSLCAHALLIATMIFLSKHISAPRLESTAKSPTVTMTMIEPPKPVTPPAPKHIFMPTPNQKNTAPPKNAIVESDHNNQAASQSKTARDPNSIMPDVVSPAKHASSLDSSPSAPPTKSDPRTTPPAPKADPTKPQPTPPQPQQPPQPQPTKADPTKAPPDPTKTPPPPKPTPAPPPKVPPPPAVNDDGLPVLPAINAATMAPQNSPNTQPVQVATPPPSMPVVPANLQGRAGMSGQPTPDSIKTPLGEYKARFYQAVGSRWYAQLSPDKLQTIGVGTVRIQYTITPNGLVSYKVIDSGGGAMTILCTISQVSIRDTSPFLKFPESMLKEYPNGYTDEFSFSIY